MSEQPLWLPLSVDDLESVDRIAGAIHTQLTERPDILAEKIRLFPAGCRKLVSDGAIVGYGLSQLDAVFGAGAE